MASAAGPHVYWCHQCNVQTRPPVGDDVVCTFCNQGFIEELENTEVEPGVSISLLPFALANLLRRPSPPSVGITRDRSITDATASLSPVAGPLSSPPRSSSSSSTSQQQSEPQNHRPRILSGQLSTVPSLFEAFMQVIEASSSVADQQEDSSLGSRHNVSTGYNSSQEVTHSIAPHSLSQDGGFVFPVPSPMLILHGDMPNGLRTLEVFIDNGQGMGAQMMPNHFSDYFLGPDLDSLIQLLAENDQNRYGTPPAAKFEIEKLPKFKITEEHMGIEVLQCAVCKDDFDLQVEVQQMPCKHIYHPDCILPWLTEHNSCPVCRFELLTNDADYEARKGQGASGQLSNEGQRTLTQINSNSDGGQAGGGTGSSNEDDFSRQFTLWGMPVIGADRTQLSRLSPRAFTQSEGLRESERRSDATPDEGAPREDGVRDGDPVQWLFRLFSSGNLFSRENGDNGEGRPDARNPSTT